MNDNLDHATSSNSGLQLLIGRQSHKLACWKQPLSKQLQSDSNRQSLTSSHQFIKQSLWTALSQALCWKKIQWLNDYHPVALTSLVMKWFEELVLALNRKGVPPLYINTSFLTGKKVNRGWHFTGPSHRPVTAVSMDVVTYYSSNLNTSYQAGYEAYTLPQPQMCFW